jgi:hypothetical protein
MDTYQALKLMRGEIFHVFVSHLETSQSCRTPKMGLVSLHSLDERNQPCIPPLFLWCGTERAAVSMLPSNFCKRSIEAAHAVAHSKHSSLSAQYHRLAARRAARKAAVALGHTLLVIIYHVLAQDKDYEE